MTDDNCGFEHELDEIFLDEETGSFASVVEYKGVRFFYVPEFFYSDLTSAYYLGYYNTIPLILRWTDDGEYTFFFEDESSSEISDLNDFNVALAKATGDTSFMS